MVPIVCRHGRPGPEQPGGCRRGRRPLAGASPESSAGGCPTRTAPLPGSWAGVLAHLIYLRD